ncbi:MAG: hypothetical protein M3416_04890, partial [Acidobacteriota bacterium]|nr:hypothetical protein [Acidobacteriota bacterium]
AAGAVVGSADVVSACVAGAGAGLAGAATAGAAFVVSDGVGAVCACAVAESSAQTTVRVKQLRKLCARP